MVRLFKITTFSCLIFLILVSCSSSIKMTRYYILTHDSLDNADKAVDTKEFETLPYKVIVDNFQVAKAYDLNRIAIRTQSNELHYYYYHYWAEPPSRAVPYFVWKQIKNLNVFQQCKFIGAPFNPDYVIEGVIHQIERTSLNGNYHAHIQMELELKDFRTNRTVVRHYIDEQLPLTESTSMNTFAAKISGILAKQTNNFIEKIYAGIN